MKAFTMAAVLAATVALPSVGMATDLEVTHWWTSGGEAAAVAEFAKAFDATGNKWVDGAIAGSGDVARPIIISRIMGLSDPRTYGSKNPGATNVLRSGNRAAAALTLLLDAAKGWLAVMLADWLGRPYGLQEGSMALTGLAAFVGHLYPVFFRFAGGKGVATALGVLLGISHAPRWCRWANL